MKPFMEISMEGFVGAGMLLAFVLLVAGALHDVERMEYRQEIQRLTEMCEQYNI